MRRIWGALLVAIAATLLATAAHAETAAPAEELLYAVVPVTAAEARELTALLRSPGAIAVDLVDATGAVVDAVPELPAALLHDVLTAPVRDWHLLHGVVRDTVDLVARPPGPPRGLFQRTLRALHRSQVFTVTAGVVRRITQPTNRTARLAIVLTARANGFPAQAEHLDTLQRALDRNDPDLAPLLRGVVEDLARMYGRHAVRLLLSLAS